MLLAVQRTPFERRLAVMMVATRLSRVTPSLCFAAARRVAVTRHRLITHQQDSFVLQLKLKGFGLVAW